mgnify:FL=1
MDDNKIIALFFARNQDAIRHTDAAYGRRLFCLAERIVQNDQDAEESVSDTYLQAWNTIPPQRPTHFYAYIAKICRNFALKKLDWKNAQKRKAEIVALTQEMESCIPDTAREKELDARELGRLLDAFLRTQTPENQMVFLRRFWYADTIGEIAARYGISESAVHMRLNRTKNRLSAYLAKEGIQV